MIAEILAVGDELVHGNALDTNSRYLARHLEEQGLEVKRFTVVSDAPGDLEAALREAAGRAEVVVTTGGLGPTEDDRTREVAAAVAGVPLELHRSSLARLERWMTGRGRTLSESNRRQAMLPRGAEVLDNPIGTAPGFRLEVGSCRLFVLPGVPAEMKRMLAFEVLPWLQRHLPGGRPFHALDLLVAGLTESALGERLADLMAPDRNPRVGVTASGGLLTVRIVGRAGDAGAARALCAKTAAALRPRLGDVLLSECDGGSRGLEHEVGRLLLDRGCTLATAESCTAGLLAGRLTAVPGISAAFLAGYVPYTDDAKVRDLDVPRGLLDRHGAVSEEVAGALARGAARRTGAHLAVAVSGIAGPGGGSAGKPVGTVCFALARGEEVRTWTRRYGDAGRETVRVRSVTELLVALARELGGVRKSGVDSCR